MDGDLTLGRLAANARNHLAKLEPGLAWWYEERIAEIMSGLGDAAPRILTDLFTLDAYRGLLGSDAPTRPSAGRDSSPAATSTTRPAARNP